jgi:hypothetical protein
VKHEKRLELTEVNGVEAPPRFRGELSVGLPIWKRLESLPRAAQLEGRRIRAADDRCRDAGVGMKRVILHIDRLVLKGFRHEDRYAVAEALREELGRQLSSPDAVQQLASAGDSWRLNVGEVRVAVGAKPSEVGAFTARGIAREIKP